MFQIRHQKQVFKFLGWLDRGSEGDYFRKVKTENGRVVRLTGSHSTFVIINGYPVPKYARDLTLEDKLMVWNGEFMEEAHISSLEYEFSFGWRTPLTEEGTLLGMLWKMMIFTNS